MAILYRINASKPFLNWRLNRTEACLYVDLRWQSLIALLHLHLFSTRIWIEGGQGCMDLLQWLSSRSRVQADYRTSDDGNILYCKFNVFFKYGYWELAGRAASREKASLLLDDSDNL